MPDLPSPSVTATTAAQSVRLADVSEADLPGAFRALAAQAWRAGDPPAGAVATVCDLRAAMTGLDPLRRGYLAVLIGLLMESEHPDPVGPIGVEAAAGLDDYLDALAGTRGDEPHALALCYLLAHFPGRADRIRAALPEGMDADDRSRVERALAELDLARPELGRVFPSPAIWQLADDERDYDDRQIRSLDRALVEANWHRDTRTVLGHLGAKAYWALQHGRPEPVPEPLPERTGTVPAGSGVDLFRPHGSVLRCPSCGDMLVLEAAGARSTCGLTYPLRAGVLDLSAASSGGGGQDDLQFKLAEMPSMGRFYEVHARPNFLRISGGNWRGAVTVADEDDYIARHVRPVAGPVLDLAAGAGRWTEVLARVVGAERVIALDLNPPMLTRLRSRLPDVPAILAGAARLPVADASLGAVLCWNALQAFPADAAAAVREVGRCLRPGGTFTLMTFTESIDPVYRHFQRSHHFPQHQDGLRLLDRDQVCMWIESAGMTVVDESAPETFLFLSARR